MAEKPVSKFKSVVYDLSRMNEWWLLSVGMILFAFIPNLYVANGYTLNLDMLIEFFMKPDFYIALAVVFGAQIFLFASNDYFDRDVDALDPGKKKRNPVCDGRVTVKGVQALLVGTLIITLVGSYYFGIWPLIFTAFTMFVYYYYTAPPLRFKNKVGLDVLSHATLINTFPYFLCIIALNDFTTGTIYLLAVFMMRSSMAQILQEIRDYEVDKLVEKNTVVVLGQKRASWLVFSIFLTLLISSIILIASYELTGWGVSLYYLILPLLSLTYLPVLYKLVRAKEYGENIERLWMGQGRENFWQVAQYAISFGIYIVIVIYLASIGYQ